MSTIEQSVEVEAPLTTVYNQWTQFEEFPRFMGGVEEVRQLDDTHLHWVAEVAGKEKHPVEGGSRPVDPLKSTAMKAALGVLAGDAQPPMVKEQPKRTPEVDPEELKRRSRDLVLTVLTGVEVKT